MFSALKRLTGKTEGGNNVPRPSHQSMSHSLQKKFARGVQYNSKYHKWIRVTTEIYRISLLLCPCVWQWPQSALADTGFRWYEASVLVQYVFVFKTIQNNHFCFLIIVELASSKVLLHWPKQVKRHKMWSCRMIQCHTVLSDTIVVTILSLGTSGPSTLLFGLLKQNINCCQFHSNKEVEMAVHE